MTAQWSAADVAALVTAFDSLREFNACSREEFVYEARWILEQRPNVLTVELADRVRLAGPKLGLKQSRTTPPMTRAQSLRYVSKCALDPFDDVAHAARTEQQAVEAPKRAERDFNQHEDGEIAKARREWQAKQAERAKRPPVEPAIVARACANAVATMPPRPSFAGEPRPTPKPFEPDGRWPEYDGTGPTEIGEMLADVAESWRE